MRSNFDDALAFVLNWEGLHGKDDADPGGETYRGISRRRHPDCVGWAYIDAGDYASADEHVGQFYISEFWSPLRCDDMPSNVATAVFDTAVNCGCGRAARWLQGAVGVVQDGAIGPKTIAAVNANPADAVRGLLSRREEHYVVIVAKNPALRKFMKGWTNRVADLRRHVDA